MARAEIASASAKAGPVGVKVGLGLDTGASAGLHGLRPNSWELESQLVQKPVYLLWVQKCHVQSCNQVLITFEYM